MQILPGCLDERRNRINSYYCVPLVDQNLCYLWKWPTTENQNFPALAWVYQPTQIRQQLLYSRCVVRPRSYLICKPLMGKLRHVRIAIGIFAVLIDILLHTQNRHLVNQS